MNQTNFNFCFKKLFPFSFFLLIGGACKKETANTLLVTDNVVASLEDSATIKSDLALVKAIVGDKGSLFLVSKKQPVGFYMTDNRLNVLSSNTKSITLNEFSSFITAFNKGGVVAVGTRVLSEKADSVKTGFYKIKVNDEWADDKPIPAGLYHFSFSPVNRNDPSLFSNLNLSFNSNADGSINGTPALYFTGIQLFGWQSQLVSLVKFNSTTLVSTYAIDGVATFGVQMGSGSTIGWGSNFTFLISINTNEISDKSVTISLKN